MNILQQFSVFFSAIFSILTNPVQMLILFGSTLLGIIFGALPGLTATLGVGSSDDRSLMDFHCNQP